jgi:hypothetical protein
MLLASLPYLLIFNFRRAESDMSDHNPLPGTGSIADSVEFVKKLWGIPSAGALPGMLIPTLSLEEINKKIADLKAVESWMAVNMNMLRGTIQALEVQSATIVNLQSMGAMMGSQQADAKAAASGGFGGSAAAPGFPFAFPGWPPAAAATEAKAEAAPVPAATPVPPTAPAPAAVAAAAEPEAPAKPAAGPAVAPATNAWWDMLQNQFKQAVSTALMPDALKVAKTAKPAASTAPSASASTPATRKTPAKTAAKKAPVRAKAKTPVRTAKKS